MAQRVGRRSDRKTATTLPRRRSASSTANPRLATRAVARCPRASCRRNSFAGCPPLRDFARKRTRQSASRSEEHTSELQSRGHLVCRLLLEKKNLQYTRQLTAEL